MINFFLASKSPRRLFILQQLGIKPIVVEPAIQETTGAHSAREHTMQLAKQKAEQVLELVNKPTNMPSIILGADTEVSVEGKILGQPENKDEAVSMLKMLSGSSHEVISSIFLISLPSNKVSKAFEVTKVTFRELDNKIIDYYLSTGEPFGKAGGYGIQGKGALLVKKINGCYFNVVGLPVFKLIVCLDELGFSNFGELIND